jgi:hypothetical protein
MTFEFENLVELEKEGAFDEEKRSRKSCALVLLRTSKAHKIIENYFLILKVQHHMCSKSTINWYHFSLNILAKQNLSTQLCTNKYYIGQTQTDKNILSNQSKS